MAADNEQERRVGDIFSDWAARGRAEGMEEGHLVTAAGVLTELALDERVRFLDLGTGNGWACRYAAERGATAWGVDLAPGMLAQAQARAGPRAGYVRASFEALPFEDEAFHVAWSMEAVYYASDVDGALAELVRVLRPDGWFHMLVDFYEENEAAHTWPEDVGLDMHLLSEDGWRRAFQRAGLGHVSTSRVKAEVGALKGKDRGPVDPWKWEEGSLHVCGRKSQGPFP